MGGNSNGINNGMNNGISNGTTPISQLRPNQPVGLRMTEGFVHDSGRNQTGNMDDGHGIKCRSREESVFFLVVKRKKLAAKSVQDKIAIFKTV